MAWQDFFLQVSFKGLLVLFSGNPFRISLWHMSSWSCKLYRGKRFALGSLWHLPDIFCPAVSAAVLWWYKKYGRVYRRRAILPRVTVPCRYTASNKTSCEYSTCCRHHIMYSLYKFKIFVMTWAMCRQLGWIRLQLPHVPHLHINVVSTLMFPLLWP